MAIRSELEKRLNEVPEELYQAFYVVSDSKVWGMNKATQRSLTAPGELDLALSLMNEIYKYLCSLKPESKDNPIKYPLTMDRLYLFSNMQYILDEKYKKTDKDIKIICQKGFQPKLVIND